MFTSAQGSMGKRGGKERFNIQTNLENISCAAHCTQNLLFTDNGINCINTYSVFLITWHFKICRTNLLLNTTVYNFHRLFYTLRKIICCCW